MKRRQPYYRAKNPDLRVVTYPLSEPAGGETVRMETDCSSPRSPTAARPILVRGAIDPRYLS